MALATTYFDLGGMELQTNTVSAEVLKAAQENPDQYRDLVVRVWGFNAYFVTLKKEYQEELIARTSY
jgi:formate C-acetyltransferase